MIYPRRAYVWPLVALILAGCESDVHKLQRLDGERLTACLLAQQAQTVYDSVHLAASPFEQARSRIEILKDSSDRLLKVVQAINASDYSEAKHRQIVRLVALSDTVFREGAVIVQSLDSLSNAEVNRRSTPREDTVRTTLLDRKAACELATRKYDAVGRQ